MLQVTATTTMGGYRYRAVFTNTAGTATSNPATLTVTTVPQVTTHPADTSVSDGATASFTALASKVPNPTVLWQSSPDGSTWTDIGDATAATYMVTATAALNGYQYRAVFTNTPEQQPATPPR